MIETISIDDPKDLVERLNGYENHFIFRGHSCSEWELESTLQRLLPDKSKEEMQKFENTLVDLYKAKFELYNKTDAKPSSKLGWLAQMQHYGAPTQLLDFSESPFVALYFATENIEKNSDSSLCIYAIDYREINKITIEEFKKFDNEFSLKYDEIDSQKDKIFESFICRYNMDVLWVSEPAYLNERIERQSGTFLYNSSKTKKIGDLLKSETYSSVKADKIIFPAKYWENYYMILKNMNISSKSIYGDLFGLAKSLKMFVLEYR